jgi:hypothetical protein
MAGISNILARLTTVRPGTPFNEAVTADRLNAITAAIRSLARGEHIVLAGDSGLLMSSSAESYGFRLGATRRATSFTHPFKITDASSGGVDSIPKIIVTYGTVQDIAPEFVATAITLSGDGTHTIFAQVEVDLDGVVLYAAIGSQLNVGKPADTDYFGYITLGTVVVGSNKVGTINQAATHSLRVLVCGRVVTGASLTEVGTFDWRGF